MKNIVLALSILVLLVVASCSAAIDLPTATSAPSTSTPQERPTDRPADKATATKPPDGSVSCKVQTGVPAGYLNLRKGTGTHYAVIRVLREGEVLTVINPGAWLEVEDQDGNHGFVNSKYCR